MMRHLLAQFLLALCLLASPMAAPLAAQDATATAEIDYTAWETEATRAENLVDAGIASTAFFENLRADLVSWRARLLAAQTANQARVDTIQAQINALGAAPVEGDATEPPAIAERRTALNAQLALAQAPRLNATSAYNRADGLIREIDAAIGDRETQALIELSPTPLNPINWGRAVTSLRDLVLALNTDLRTRLSNPTNREEMLAGAPVSLALLVLGLLLLLRGRSWMARLTERLQLSAVSRGRAAVAFLVSLGQMALPIIGVGLVGTALISTDIPGESLMALILAGMALLGSVFFSMWLAGRLFPVNDRLDAALDVEPQARPGLRRTAVTIGLLLGIGTMAQAVAALDEIQPAARGVLLLPVYLGLALAYWRMALLLRGARVVDEDGPNFSQRVIGLIGQALILVAIFGPILAAAGYVNAAEAVMIPTALTLGLLGVFVALQSPIRDLYAVISRGSAESASEALIPVLINFLLAFAALPVLGLIWGMRPQQLNEIYTAFWSGFTVGETTITPSTILAVILVFALGYTATRLLQGALKSTVLPRTRMDAGARNAVSSGVGYIGIALAALIAINAGGIDLTALGFVLGALSVGIGFGLQNVVSNFVSGIILLIERPISEGDWIEVGPNMGIVKDISVRSTRIETFDKTDVIVPNADFISGTVTNWTRGNTIGRAIVTVGVAYGTDTRRVEAILLELVRTVPGVAAYPEPGVDFLGFGADSLEFRVRAILRDVNNLVSIKTEINHRIAERFVAEGIEIPFSQRDIWLRNPEALGQGRPATATTAPPEDETKT